MRMSKLFFVFLIAFFTSIDSFGFEEDSTSSKKKREYLQYNIGPYKFKERNNYLTFGFGANFYPSLVNPDDNGNFSIDLHFFDKQDRFWHVGYQSNAQSYLFSSGNFVYLHALKMSRALYHREKQYFKVAAFIGPSFDYTRYYPTDTVKSLAAEPSFGVGIQSQVEFILKPVYDFGIAITPFVNVNTIQTVFGVTVSFYGSNAMVKKNKGAK
jgi:hypothetical protein